MESPGPGGLASLRLVALGTPKPVCAPSSIKPPHQDTRGSGLQWAPWGLAYELGTQQAEVDPPELQAQKVPRGGPLAGQHGVKAVRSSGSTPNLVASKLPQSSCPRGLEGPRGGPAGATGSGETLLLQEHQGAWPQTLLHRECWAPAWPQPSGARSAHRGLSSALWPPALPGDHASPRPGKSSGLSNGPEAPELSRPQTSWVYNLLMSPPLSWESSGRPAGLRPPLHRTGLDPGCQGPQHQPCCLPCGWTDGGHVLTSWAPWKVSEQPWGRETRPQIFQTTA